MSFQFTKEHIVGRKNGVTSYGMTLFKYQKNNEPEQFPGMIYKTIYGTTCLIFASGKVVVAGSKSEQQITIEELVNN